jgi:hypothetical protein
MARGEGRDDDPIEVCFWLVAPCARCVIAGVRRHAWAPRQRGWPGKCGESGRERCALAVCGFGGEAPPTLARGSRESKLFSAALVRAPPGQRTSRFAGEASFREASGFPEICALPSQFFFLLRSCTYSDGHVSVSPARARYSTMHGNGMGSQSCSGACC